MQSDFGGELLDSTGVKDTKLFHPGDWNGFWALLADNLANLVIAAGICKGVFGMSDEIVFGRILPGLGVSLLVGLSFYAWQAVKLGRAEGREDVTALPYGISTPVLFVYLFGVIAPVYFSQVGEHPETAGLTAWRVGVAAAFIGGIIECMGSVLGPLLKRVTPRAGMLGTLAGIALVYIAAVPFASLFEHPLIGFPALALVLVGLVAGRRLPGGVPAGLAAIVVGTVIGLGTGDATFDTAWRPSFMIPVPIFSDLFAGLGLLWAMPAVLGVVIPIEIYNFIETMNNVESAEAAGDRYDVRTCQFADGAGTMVGALFGSAFPSTVYIGHPAYKRLGARTGYALGVGIVIFLLAVTGMHEFLHSLIPTAAVEPLLVFVGAVIVGQAFTSTPKKHAFAVAVAMLPHVGNLLVTKIQGALRAAGADLDPELITKMAQTESIHWHGQSALHQGAIVSGLLWGAIAACTIDGERKKAFGFALAGSVLTLFGVIHGALGWDPSHVPIALGYALLGGVLLLPSEAGELVEDD